MAAFLFEEVEGLFAARGEIGGQESSWNSLETILVMLGRPAEAAKWTEKLMDLFDQQEDPEVLATRACFMGEKLLSAGGETNSLLAVPLLERALAASASPAHVGQPWAAQFRMQAKP